MIGITAPERNEIQVNEYEAMIVWSPIIPSALVDNYGNQDDEAYDDNSDDDDDDDEFVIIIITVITICNIQ